jgi:ankyrin repeat protein
MSSCRDGLSSARAALGEQWPVEWINNDTTPLQFAANNGHDLVVKFLLEIGQADPDSKESKNTCKPILLAATNRSTVVTRLLLKRADLRVQDSKGHTSLHLAILHGHHDFVDLLIRHDLAQLDLEAQDGDCRTSLHWATHLGYAKIIQSLVNITEKREYCGHQR